MSEPSLAEKVVALDEALASAGIPHAFGGALALAYYAEPRATIDVDLNVFTSPSESDAVRTALEPLGVDPSNAPAALIERDGQGRWWWGRTPIDLFFAYDPIHDEMAREVRRMPFGAAEIPVLSPEHLAVCKAMFDRTKDWIDIEQIIAGTPDLDSSQITSWLERMVGGDDERSRRFAELSRRT